jgi:hypothetical protein
MYSFTMRRVLKATIDVRIACFVICTHLTKREKTEPAPPVGMGARRVRFLLSFLGSASIPRDGPEGKIVGRKEG